MVGDDGSVPLRFEHRILALSSPTTLKVMEYATTPVAGGDEAVRVLDVVKDFGDTYAEVTAWRVPESDRYPDGIKYAMQYGNADGETIVRYDNFPDHPGVAHHHRHTRGGSVEDVTFEGLRTLFERFKTEVETHGDSWD